MSGIRWSLAKHWYEVEYTPYKERLHKRFFRILIPEKPRFAESKKKMSGVLSRISEGINEGSKSHPGYQGLVNW